MNVSDNYYDNRIKNMKNQLFLAKQRVNKLENQLSELKRQKNIRSKTIRERLNELFSGGFE